MLLQFLEAIMEKEKFRIAYPSTDFIATALCLNGLWAMANADEASNLQILQGDQSSTAQGYKMELHRNAPTACPYFP
jgi:hypothetical protein